MIIRAKRYKQRSWVERVEAKATCWAADIVQEFSTWRRTKRIPKFALKDATTSFIIGLLVSTTTIILGLFVNTIFS